MSTTTLKLANIVTTSGTQIRAKVDVVTVDEYATAWTDGAVFPPVIVFHDGNQYILADGFHRVMAATKNGFKDIQAEIHKGTRADALKYALGANAAHGLKRTNADKRRSVELALSEWPKLSDVQIAKICAVSDKTVAEVRRNNIGTSEVEETRIGADGKERKMPVKKTSPPPPTPSSTTTADDDDPPRITTYVPAAPEPVADLQKQFPKATTSSKNAVRWWWDNATPEKRGVFFLRLLTSFKRVEVGDKQRLKKEIVRWVENDVAEMPKEAGAI